MNSLVIVDLVGTFVFAISGALAAANKRFDFMGVCIIAFVTALGGGTLRDLLIGAKPVGWMENKWYLLTVLLGVLITFLLYKRLQHLRKTLFLFDAVGLGIFSIAGLEKALSFGIDPFYALICGMMTATMGGMLRDVLCNEIPLIFRKEIYATAGLIGASFYLLLDYFGLPFGFNFGFTIAVVIAVRVLAVKMNVGLPKIKVD
jgi:uncharacterized membrane protein YeiH